MLELHAILKTGNRPGERQDPGRLEPPTRARLNFPDPNQLALVTRMNGILDFSGRASGLRGGMQQMGSFTDEPIPKGTES